MVQAIVAGVGGLLGLIGAILTIVVAIGQDFVVVTFPPVQECEENFLGTLGVYKATYDPACAAGDNNTASQALQRFARTESPVTEFWPLFPSFTNFGGAFGEAQEGEEFTTCEEFYAANGPADRVASRAGTVGLAETIAGVALAPNYELFVSTVGDVRSGVGLAVKGLVAQSIPGGFNQTVLGLQEPAAAARGLLAIIDGTAQGAPFGCTRGPTLLSPYTGCTGGANLGLFNVSGAADDSAVFSGGLGAIILGGVDTLTDGAIDAVSGGLGISLVIPVATRRGIIEGIIGGIQLHVGAGLVDATTPHADVLTLPSPAVFGGVLGIDASIVAMPGDTTQDLGPVKAAVTALYGVAVASMDAGAIGLLLPAFAAFDLCPASSPQVSSGACASTVITSPGLPNEPASLDNTDTNSLCLSGTQLDSFAATSLATTLPEDCTFLKFMQAVGEAVQSGGIDLSGVTLPDSVNVTQVVPLLAGLLTQCAGSGVPLNFDSCLTTLYEPLGSDVSVAEQSGVPEQLDGQTYVLCTALVFQGLPPCVGNSTFRGFVPTLAASVAEVDPVAAGTLTTVFTGICAGVSTLTECAGLIGSESENPLLNGLQAGLADAALVNIPGLNGTTEERIAGCNDDLKDKEVFERAQKLVPVCIVLSGLGALLAVAAGTLNKTPIAFVAGGLMLFGGVLLMITLILVRGAPVYGLVSEDGTGPDYEPLYKASGGQILALMGVALPVVGGIALVVSAFLNKPGSEDALSNKVDAA